VKAYIQECADIGFDIVEISSGFVTLPTDDWLRLVERIERAGLKGETRGRDSIRGGRGDSGRRTGSRRDTGCRLDHQVGAPFYRGRRILDHDRIRMHHRKRPDLAHRLGRQDHSRTWGAKNYVRSRGPGGLRLVHQELRARAESFCRPQPDRPAGGAAARHLGGTKSLWGRVVTFKDG